MLKKIIFLCLLFTAIMPYVCSGGKRILFIGDSITDGGWGRSGGSMKPSAERNKTDLNHVYGHSYVFLTAAWYQAHNPEEDYLFFNRGISGYTLADLEEHWQEDVIDIKPDVLSVLVGTNDVDGYLRNGDAEGFDFNGWEMRYRGLLDTALASNPDMRLVLCAPFVANTGKMRNSKDYDERKALITRLDEIVERVAKSYNAVFLPYHSLFDKLEAQAPDSANAYWIWDGIHPTAAGHQLMSEMWIKAVDKHKLLKR